MTKFNSQCIILKKSRNSEKRRILLMKLKKLVALCAAIALTLGSISFIGCTPKAEQKIMTVSLNPQVEFVLDADNTVVSVNALNEEGNLIINAQTFTGKNAEDAAKLFVEVSKETGFLISGSVKNNENKIEISFSGNEKAAKELFEDVKATVNDYLTSENVTATLTQADAITKQQLQALVAECAPYLEQKEIAAMKYSKLIDTIKESRKETAEFYSQELKAAYYQAKAMAIEKSELDTIKSNLDALTKMAVDGMYGAYELAISAIENTRNSLLVAEDSPYQVALAAFRTAKVEYIKYRNYVASLEQNQVTAAITEQLDSLSQALDVAETALINAEQTAQASLNSAQTSLKTAYDAIISLINDYSTLANEHADKISADWKTEKEQFFTDFETNYAAAITAAKDGWAQMQSQLQPTE